METRVWLLPISVDGEIKYKLLGITTQETFNEIWESYKNGERMGDIIICGTTSKTFVNTENVKIFDLTKRLITKEKLFEILLKEREKNNEI